MRADRLLSMIWLLRIHGGLSTAEIAERLDVSRRTVLRDVEALSAAGVPVYCERGPHGGVRLLPGYRTEVTALSEDESRALFTAISSWGAEAVGLGNAFTSGVRKLLAAVPDAHRDASMHAASRIVIDPQGWLPQPDALRPGDAFATVQAAVFARERLQITYRSHNSTTTQDVAVDPHGLVSAGSNWYLCATTASQIHFFKIARISAATLLSEPCQGADIDVEQAWHEHRAQFLNQFTPVEVTGWLHRDRKVDAAEWTLRVCDAEPTGQAPGEEWQPVRLSFMDNLHAVSVLLRLGADVRVDAPESIRAHLLDHLDETKNLYARHDSEHR